MPKCDWSRAPYNLLDKVRLFAAQGLTHACGVIAALVVAWSPVNADAQLQYHRPGYTGAPLFSDPVAACVDDFAHYYLPNYPNHVLIKTEPRVAANVVAGTKCTFFNAGQAAEFTLYGYTTIVCPSGYRRVAGEPFCVPLAREPAEGQCSPRRGQPIAAIDGEKIQVVRDFATSDGRLYFERTYRSNFMALTPLGFNWTSNFHRIFATGTGPNGTSTFIFLGDGRIARFNLVSGTWRPSRPSTSGGVWDGGWTATATNYRRDVSWTLAPSGTNWVFTDEDGRVETYNSALRITSVRFPGGYTWTYSYNASGQYTAVTDTYGRAVQFAYTAHGLLDYVAAPDGRQYRFAYDETPYLPAGTNATNLWSRLVNVIYPDNTAPLADNPTVAYLYEIANQPNSLTGVVDERGVRTRTWGYDAGGRAVSSALAGGLNQYLLSFNDTANTTTVTNPFGRTSILSSPLNSQQMRLFTQEVGSATANVAASTTALTYDSNGFVNQFVDAEARTTIYTKNVRGLPTSWTEGSGTPQARTVTATWHATLPFPTQIVEPGLTRNATYDTEGRLTQVQLLDTTSQSVPYSTNGQQRTWVYTYTVSGLLDTVDGPLAGAGDITDYNYDAQGNLASVTNALGHITLITSVDGAGRPLSVIDPNGVVAAIAYTPRGWISSITVNPGAAQRQTSFAYDNAGHVTQVTLPSGGTLTYTYDNAERVTEVRNNFNERMNLSYNTAGQVTQRQMSTSGGTLRATLSLTYDEIGRVRQMIGAASQTETRAYDRNNNQTSLIDPRGQTWSTAYDPLNRVISETNPLSQSVQAAYGTNGRDNISSQTDGRALQTAFVRNGFGDVIRETSPDSAATTYWYDAAGSVTQMQDAETVQVNFAYDNAYRLTQKTFPSAPSLNQTFVYDDVAGGNRGKGRVTSAGDTHGARTFVYDEFGQVTRETRTINGHSYQTDYTYAPNGGVSQITYPTGRQVRFIRDAQDRITAVDTRSNSGGAWASVASNVTWRPFGPLEGLTYGNGLQLANSYDQNYWLTGIAVTGAVSGATVNMTFGRDAAGAVASTTDAVNPSRSASYAYTNAARLQSQTVGADVTSWTYDAAGNRTRETRLVSSVTTYDDYIYPTTSNRLSEVRDQVGAARRTISYRLNGQTSQDVRTGTGTFAYTYNANGRLIEARLNGSLVASYGYDAAGRRITRVVTGAPNVSREYLYFPDGRLMAEADGTGAIVREYVWLEDLPLAAVNVSGGSSTLFYIHASHRGEPVAMTDAGKAKVWDASYTPFGAATIFTATTPLDLRLPGQQLQGETGLHQNWMRDYDPGLGRYAEPDPIGLAGGPNVYSYVGQDPLNYVDPDGQLLWLAGAVLASPQGRFALGFAAGFATDVGMQVLQNVTRGQPAFCNIGFRSAILSGLASGAGFSLGGAVEAATSGALFETAMYVYGDAINFYGDAIDAPAPRREQRD